jgi:hypothetical protein
VNRHHRRVQQNHHRDPQKLYHHSVRHDLLVHLDALWFFQDVRHLQVLLPRLDFVEQVCLCLQVQVSPLLLD